MNELIKTCSGCGKEKLLTDFHRDSGKKDGHKTQCKVCRGLDGALYVARMREHIREYGREYRKKNRERLRKYRNEYYKKRCYIDKKYLALLERDAKLWRDHIKEEMSRVNRLQAEIDSWPVKADQGNTCP